MSRPALGDLLHTSLHRPDPASRCLDLPVVTAPRWAYSAGALGGGVMGAGVLLMTLCVWSQAPGLGMALIVTAVGAAVLGIAELALHRLAGATVAGLTSLLVPVTFAVLHANRDAMPGLVASFLLVGALAVFALGHALARGLAYTRACAAGALAGLLTELAAGWTGAALPDWLHLATLSCLALVGLTLPLTLVAIRPSACSRS